MPIPLRKQGACPHSPSTSAAAQSWSPSQSPRSPRPQAPRQTTSPRAQLPRHPPARLCLTPGRPLLQQPTPLAAFSPGSLCFRDTPCPWESRRQWVEQALGNAGCPLKHTVANGGTTAKEKHEKCRDSSRATQRMK